jgi:hypothetical protein
LSTKQLTINHVIIIPTIIFALLFAFACYQVLNWVLFPWLNLTIVFGSSFLCLFFAFIVKIQLRVIKVFILTIASTQILFSSIFLSQPELLRNNWQWMLFSLAILFSAIFWDLFSRRIHQINFIGRIACVMLTILSFFKFVNLYFWIDYLLVALIIITTCLLLFSKNTQLSSE